MNKKIVIYFKLFFIATLYNVILLINITFARPNTLCNGKEFNRRIKTLVDGGDVVADYKVMRFERGDTPPSDSDYYVDISEDNDESVIAYISAVSLKDKQMKKVNLYWYATDTIFMNENTSLMFQGFANIKHIDLSGFSYFEGLDDVRYMFKDCRNLRSIELQPSGYNPVNGEEFTPTEMQGMYYGCQSLKSIDLSKFKTYLVSNMSELFCKCFNLTSIIVDKNNWNIESVTNFNRMFTDCHLLRSTTGKKAVDIADDDYERFAGVGLNGADTFIRDNNTEYIEYVSDAEYVPIEEQGYLMQLPETMEEYYEEPEEDGSDSNSSQNNIGNANNELGASVNDSMTNQQQNATTTNNSQSYLQNNIVESSSLTENIAEYINANLQETINNDTNNNEIVETVESVEEGDGKRIVELDEFLNPEGKNQKEERNIVEVLLNDYQPLLVTLIIALFVLFILIGMVLYLYKEKKSSNDNSSSKL